ncbi:enoyl-CoA hydratase/isomerase family protein [Nocardia africana]|uniref:Probable enoyl-CoA hydratase echA8 n=1 Tax=Nocardia africana TaxID=134964 RepID=A0A378WPB6_9NOCA|nr:enoyl-CoA hydratase/isomerase family protein [Nocardia africana]MCC3314963.1 enoyl-CoA hydratase/isomerase family protein [Nocardia africana]SUA42752.1 Probable enoyl-CoA hydratase echA8 [Nocardia africana]
MPDLKDWQHAVGGFVPRPAFEDYAAKYADYAKMQRRDGIIEIALHTRGGPVTADESWFATHNAWGQLWQEVGNDPDNEVLILTGTGDAWYRTAAATAQEQSDRLVRAQLPDDHAYEHVYYDGTKLLENLVFAIDIPTIAVINGPSAAHTEIALLCDITLAAETATIIDPHFAVGVPPGDGQQLTLQELLGAKRAAYHLYTGQPIDAHTALQLGLVNEVLPADRILTRAWELAELIAAKPRTTRRLTHAIAQRPWKRRLVDDLGFGLAHEMFGIAALPEPH